MGSGYERLLEPYRIGRVKTRNRIIKTGASMCYWHENDLHMSEKAKAYYGALARGGVGLLIIESPTIRSYLPLRSSRTTASSRSSRARLRRSTRSATAKSRA